MNVRTPIPLVDLKRLHSHIEHEIKVAINTVISSSTFISGSQVERFEEAFASFCDSGFCVAVANGTDALVLALLSLGIGKGDEVITTACSFFATAEAISRVGAKPVFCDIDQWTANINVNQIVNKLTENTRAIIPVHLYGQPADMGAVNKIAHDNELWVIEDCAQSVGARFGGARVGSLGDISCFSFYPSKNLGAMGDAGAVVTNNESLAYRCRMLANHGGTRKYEHLAVGFNSRMDEMQAAVLNPKLGYLDEWNAQRELIAKSYREKLQHPDIQHMRVLPEVESVNHLFTIRTKKRDMVVDSLRTKGVCADIHYPVPLPFVPAYEHLGCATADFVQATLHASSVLSLPIFPMMEDEEVEYIIHCLLEIIDTIQ
jgi:dTDP-4-amino-4,6-dideoxygalactose transaminase